MVRLRKTSRLFDFLKIFAGGIAFFLLLFSVSVIKVIPFFEIKHVSVLADGSKRELALITKEIISRELDNNYLLLLINRDYLLSQLKRETEYYIRNLKILDFDWRSGYLIIKLYTNKAIASLNGRYNIATNGLIFGFKKPKQVLEIYDSQKNWDFGNIYNGISGKVIPELHRNLGIKKVFVKNTIVYLKGDKVELLAKKELVNRNTELVNNYVHRISAIYGEKKHINLLGKKSIYIKIFKERTDE